MIESLLGADQVDDAIPILLVDGDDRRYLDALSEFQRAYVASSGFRPAAGSLALVPGDTGHLALVLFGLGSKNSAQRTPFLPGKLAEVLPPGTYRLADASDDPALAALAFALGSYRYSAYRTNAIRAEKPRLALGKGVDLDALVPVVSGVTLTRDLINAPANDMGPAELEQAARRLAQAHGAQIESIVGDELVGAGLPLIHAVGRASERQPRLIDLRWGGEAATKITLVGKGVCFDTGGLDIKSATGMSLMKKDMGGGASALGLAAMIMAARLPVRLRVLVPAVENAISGSAFRPGDVLRSRAGLTVSIGNTDAEGRLVLADALTLAGDEDPQLLIDLATLTGAARAALGPEVPPFYTDSEDLASALAEASRAVDDPVWRMPLWRPYERLLDSKVADIDNTGTAGMAGSVAAALFLSRFIRCPSRWVHFDIYGWNPTSRPGRPEGGEAQAIRAVFELLKRRYPA